MKNKITILSVLASLFFITSCAEPFTISGPWGNITKDEDGNVSGSYTPPVAVEVQGTK